MNLFRIMHSLLEIGGSSALTPGWVGVAQYRVQSTGVLFRTGLHVNGKLEKIRMNFTRERGYDDAGVTMALHTRSLALCNMKVIAMIYHVCM